MIKSRFIQAEQKPGRSCEVNDNWFQTKSLKKSQISHLSHLTSHISDLRSQIEIDLSPNYCEKIVAKNSAANRRDPRLRNEAAVPVRRTHDPEAKLQRKEFRP